MLNNVKFAYIDHRLNDKITFSDDIIQYAKKNSISIDFAETFDEFNRLHGNINNYDVLIIHPGQKNFDDLIQFRKKSVIPVVVVAAGVLEYEDDVENIRVINYLDKKNLFDFNKCQSAK